MTRYVALLRGINVGGRNRIVMADLRACFEGQGFGDVSTYIQSGNVLFTAPKSKGDALVDGIEATLAETFDYSATVVLRTLEQMRGIVSRAPAGFGTQPTRYRYDVLFLKKPLTASEAMESVPAREGVDEMHPGAGVLYYSRLASEASRSRLSRLVSLPSYQRITIRNWNTTTKLLELMEGRES
jgi:uncharacterized protein (DUF1697 family)